MARDMIRNNLPLDRVLCGIDIAMFIDIQPKSCERDDELGRVMYLNSFLLS